jgi:hypothetical protein
MPEPMPTPTGGSETEHVAELRAAWLRLFRLLAAEVARRLPATAVPSQDRVRPRLRRGRRGGRARDPRRP